jgi:hypothetical protein
MSSTPGGGESFGGCAPTISTVIVLVVVVSVLIETVAFGGREDIILCLRLTSNHSSSPLSCPVVCCKLLRLSPPSGVNIDEDSLAGTVSPASICFGFPDSSE